MTVVVIIILTIMKNAYTFLYRRVSLIYLWKKENDTRDTADRK